MPLAEAKEMVVHRQVTAGSNPSTRENIPNAVVERKGVTVLMAGGTGDWEVSG